MLEQEIALERGTFAQAILALDHLNNGPPTSGSEGITHDEFVPVGLHLMNKLQILPVNHLKPFEDPR